MNSNMDPGVIGIDIGGTKIAGGLFSVHGDLLHQNGEGVADKSGKEVLSILSKLIIDLQKSALKKSTAIIGTGIAVPGRVDPESGLVWAPNIDGWSNIDLLNILNQNFGSDIGPIVIDSDRTCYILGEQWKGKAQGYMDAIYLAVGTGIGAGILCHGQVIKGHSGTAGAIGWMALDRSYISSYDQCGCFEFHASGSGLSKLYSQACKPDAPFSSTQDVFSAFRKSDPLATEIILNAVSFWGMATANLVSLFNPEIIIFGGGVFGPALSLLDDIRSEAEKWAQPLAFQNVKLSGSALGTSAGLYGAARLILNNLAR